MKKMLTKVKNSKGYVSIETIIVAGLVIGLGVFTIIAFQNKGNEVTKKAMTNIDNANSQYKVVNPGE
ncbi:TPA: hypothetical protein N2D99_002038 [Clostridium botulinum]|nr:hypothetical protein [Clostridium botulinum]